MRALIGPALETERLILRTPAKLDFEPWARMLADPEAARFIGGPQSRSGAWRNLALMAGAWVIEGFGNFSVLEKSSGRWIGRAGPWQPEGWPGQEIGWAFDRSAWGKGYATEAVTCCIDWAFDHLGWNDVVHAIDPANTASIALARRLGAERRSAARLPPPFDSPVDIYGQSRSAWRARNQNPPAAGT